MLSLNSIIRLKVSKDILILKAKRKIILAISN
jgi:hypothetical protein